MKNNKNKTGLQFIKTVAGKSFTFKKMSEFIEANNNRENTIIGCYEAFRHIVENAPKKVITLRKRFFRKYGNEIQQLLTNEIISFQEVKTKESETVTVETNSKGTLSKRDCKQIKRVARIYCKGYLTYMSKKEITRVFLCRIFPKFVDKTLYNKFLIEVDLIKTKINKKGNNKDEDKDENEKNVK